MDSTTTAQPVEHVAKPWGHEEIFAAVADRYAGKLLHVSAGRALSLQWHQDKDETLTVLSGEVEMDLGRTAASLRTVPVPPGTSVHVTPRLVHRIRALTDAVLVEVSTAGHGWREDIVRLDDRYGRTGTTSA